MISKQSLTLLFIIGLSIFIVTSFGVFDKLSNDVSSILFNWFGYTNKWSGTYGPSWFVNTSNNLSAFGSKEVALIFSLIFFAYLYLNNRKKDAFEFIVTIFSSVIFLIIVKIISSDLNSINLLHSFKETFGGYPSGHTFISTVLYLIIAFHLSKHSINRKLKKFYFISGIFIIIIVGIARITGAEHTVTEVIAGWSLGISWISLLKILQLKIRVMDLNRKHYK